VKKLIDSPRICRQWLDQEARAQSKKNAAFFSLSLYQLSFSFSCFLRRLKKRKNRERVLEKDRDLFSCV
jgi:hypothetical protein